MNPKPSVLFRMIKAGFLVYPALAGGLWIWSPLGFWASLYLALVMQLLPLLGLAQLALAEDEGPVPRVSLYITSGAFILVLGWLGLLIGTGEVGREFMGLGPARVIPTVFWTLGTVTAILLLLLLFYVGRRLLGVKESGLLEQLLPQTPREKLLFLLLSLSAGVGEEIAFRGFALPALALVTGSWWSGAIISSVAFGFLHGYQGWLGILRTGTMGFTLAAAFIFSGSLWPAIMAHAALDVISGLVLGRTLLKEK